MFDFTEMKDEDIQTDFIDNVERDKCCAKCRYFEERTCFCRYNPPTPIVTTTKSGQSFVTSVYSKISMPALDWC